MSSFIIPTMKYENAPEMIEWLCSTFGLKQRLIVEDGTGGITHAQLTLGGGMLMLSSYHDDEFSKLQSTPARLGGNTQSSYLIVDNADKVYQAVKTTGAEIMMEICDQDYGGRGFTCRDPEGQIWSIGTYNPWAD